MTTIGKKAALVAASLTLGFGLTTSAVAAIAAPTPTPKPSTPAPKASASPTPSTSAQPRAGASVTLGRGTYNPARIVLNNGVKFTGTFPLNVSQSTASAFTVSLSKVSGASCSLSSSAKGVTGNNSAKLTFPAGTKAGSVVMNCRVSGSPKEVSGVLNLKPGAGDAGGTEVTWATGALPGSSEATPTQGAPKQTSPKKSTTKGLPSTGA